jgi:hypothetical protein
VVLGESQSEVGERVEIRIVEKTFHSSETYEKVAIRTAWGWELEGGELFVQGRQQVTHWRPIVGAVPSPAAGGEE